MLSLLSNLIPGAAFGKIFLKYILPVIAVLGLIFAGYLYVHNLQTQNAKLTTQVSIDQVAIKTRDVEIAADAQAIQDWSAKLSSFQADVSADAAARADAQNQVENLSNVFLKHDLGALASKKPTAIQLRVNAASDRTGLMLRCASGDASACGTKTAGTTSRP